MKTSDGPVDSRPTIVVAGATGFVGRALVKSLSARFRVVGLTRNAERARSKHGDLEVEWVSCDLYSLSSLREALKGADYAAYLVHSMLPTAGLTQASFEDLDVLLADNFARAAAENSIKQIVYLGGLIPTAGEISTHLHSRLEVERVLGARGVPTTVLRAGLVVGPDGSSFRILRLLVSRLPVMVLPSWTATMTTPIALADVVELLSRAVGDESVFGVTSDVGGPDTMSYRELLEMTAETMGARRLMLPVPLLSPRLSSLWVNLVTGSPRELVRPLIRSLECEMIATNKELQSRWGLEGTPIKEALRGALTESPRQTKKRALAPFPRAPRELPVVRSVQRLPIPAEGGASHVAAEYSTWLAKCFAPLIGTKRDETGSFTIQFRPSGTPLIELIHSRTSSRTDRETFEIAGGLLVRKSDSFHGRLEFREVTSANTMLAALHDFTPRLPWFIYRVSQAFLHLWVMKAFGRHLAAHR